jgi:cell division protein FtsL
LNIAIKKFYCSITNDVNFKEYKYNSFSFELQIKNFIFVSIVNYNNVEEGKMFGFKKIRLFFAVLLIGAWIVMYVSNVIAINKLFREIYVLENQLEKLEQENLILMKKINELEDASRIIPLVKKNLNMNEPSRLPVIMK